MEGPPSRSQGAIAKLLGVTQPAVRAWMRGTSRPEPHLREAIEVLTGVPEATWELESERVAKQAAIERIHDAEVLAAELPADAEPDSEPTNPAVPVAKKLSSAPPPPDVPAPLVVVDSVDFQTKSRDRFALAALRDATEDDADTMESELPSSTPANLPPVATEKVSERERRDTDPDPRAGEELPHTPKPLTVHDRERNSTPPGGEQ